MPTLLEAWLAEQTAEHLPRQHPATIENDAPKAREGRHPPLHFGGLDGRMLDSGAPHIRCSAEPQSRAAQWIDRYMRRRGLSRLRWL